MTRLPIRQVASSTGGQCKVPIQFPGRTVQAAAWCLQVGRAPIILLDTDIPDNEPADRPITHTLYIRGREMRFCQELVLGVGAVRSLAAQSIEPAVWHVNEGHAAMSLLERISVGVKGGASLEVAEKEVKSRTVFTLHTPVPAGNEVFEFALAEKYLAPWATSVKADMSYLARLGASHNDQQGRFDLGAMAIRLAALVNGVSKRHAEVVSRDWSHLLNTPALAITNGVHTPTWMGRDVAREVAARIGPDWPTLLVEHPEEVEAIDEIPNEELWASHLARKQLFTRFARGRFRRQFARHGSSPDELRSVERMLPPERLTLGFARRFATYKRATLMFHNVPWLQAILTNPDRPVQVVFAGKAHPADRPGQDFIRHIVELSRTPELRGHICIMENYDHRVARFLVQGVDVWVNNPRPPEEASGTSGMKAAINGAINASVLDGWWAEGYENDNGWAFGSSTENHDHGAQDNADAIAFYRLLQDEIVPLFYQRDEQGVPQEWVELMKRSMKSTLAAFSSQRMVKEYAELAYLKLGR
jgi:starch phosphorylase